KQVRGHGWLLLDGGKISKSKGNVVDPVLLIERYGVDALKYFLLREYTFGQDGLYTNETMINRINGDLANDLGNLLSRTCGMTEKYFGGHVTKPARGEDKLDVDLAELAVSIAAKVEAHMEGFGFNHALAEIWTLVSASNKYIDETQPWALAKDEAQRARLEAVLYALLESLRIISVLICPFMHHSTEEMRRQIGVSGEADWADASVWGKESVYDTAKGASLFPRLDVAEELAYLESLGE
ncbi:MAG: class I tRNA ligase family protein, partial [Clostridiales Family XIII bacterium]|nr:class I tRNA ligase family protein [Clostridiales Family XIII bacterium]